MLAFLKKIFAKQPVIYEHPIEHIFNTLAHSDFGAHGYTLANLRLANESKAILENYEQHKDPSWPSLSEIINKQDAKGNTLLHYLGADLDLFLIEKGADANIVNAFGQTPLLYNAENISVQNKALICATKDLNTANKETGETLLCTVLKKAGLHSAELVGYLLDKGADSNKESRGQTPLGTAIKPFLTTPFANSFADRDSTTPDLFAEQQAITYMSALFLHKHGARLNAEESKQAVAVLQQFNQAMQEGISLPYTVAATAMICLDSLSGDTKLPAEFLHNAAGLHTYIQQYGAQKAKLFELLSGICYRGIIQKSAQIDVLNTDGLTPLCQAFHKKNRLFASALIKAGADVTQKTSRQQTLLHEAVKLDDPFLTAQLLKTGKIDVNAQDADGNTALHLATGDRVAETLLRFGANPALQNKQGETVFDDVPNIQTALLLSGYLNHVRDQRALKLATQSKTLNTLQEKQATRNA